MTVTTDPVAQAEAAAQAAQVALDDLRAQAAHDHTITGVELNDVEAELALAILRVEHAHTAAAELARVAHAKDVAAWRTATEDALAGAHDAIAKATRRLEAALDDVLAAAGSRNATVKQAHDRLHELAEVGDLPDDVGTAIMRGWGIDCRVFIGPGLTVAHTDTEAVLASTIVRAFDRAAQPLERLGRLHAVAGITTEAPAGAAAPFLP